MSESLQNKKVAILATDGFERVELAEPRKALQEAGAQTYIVSPAPGSINAWDLDHWADSFPVDVALQDADPNDYDALLLPGGVINPDKLRLFPQAVQFVSAFNQSGKPIAAICHGPWLLINAGAVAGRQITSWPSLKADLNNAGALWVDQEVVVDQGIVTSRKPDDIPAFNRKMIEEFAEGSHAGRRQLAGSRQ